MNSKEGRSNGDLLGIAFNGILKQGIDWDHVGGIWQKALSLTPTRETNIVDALASMLRGAS